MILNLSYRSIFYDKIINVQYDDVAHTITGGSLGSSEGVSGLGAGVEFYRQTVGADYWSVVTSNAYPYAIVQPGNTATACDLAITDVDVTPAMNGSLGVVEVTATGTGTKRYALGGNIQVSNIFNNVPPGTYLVEVTRTEDLCKVIQSVTVPGYADLEVTAIPTNTTVAGADDGKVLLTVIAGSGDYTANFITEGVSVDLTDGTVTELRVGLEPDLYTIEVTDNITGQIVVVTARVADPANLDIPTIKGTYLAFPPISSISFVIPDGLDQGLDNVLFCDRRHKNVHIPGYFQKLLTADSPKVQFKSNYTSHFLIAYDYRTAVQITSFDIEMVEQNVGKTEDFSILIKDHIGHPGQSRLYFNSIAFPVPVQEGTIFTIKNNADGLDGDYLVQQVSVDDNNLQYAVFNAVYPGGVSSPGTGTFLSNTANYNVYEAIVSGLDPGTYYLVLTAITGNNNENQRTAVSEPIDVQEEHPNTIKFVGRNIDNAFGAIWSSGLTVLIRVDGEFGLERTPQSDRVVSRSATDSIIKISAKKRRAFPVNMVDLPGYMVEKLSILFDLDSYSVNDVVIQSDQDLAIDYAGALANVGIVVEQADWFGKYNSDDIMSSGTVVCDEIDLLKVVTSGGTVTLDFNNKRERIFTGLSAINANKVIAFIKDTIALRFSFTFNITGTPKTLTFPSTCVSDSASWNSVDHKFTANDDGKYMVNGVFDGMNWQLNFTKLYA